LVGFSKTAAGIGGGVEGQGVEVAARFNGFTSFFVGGNDDTS